MSLRSLPAQVTVVDHPLVQHKLSYLRDRETPTVHFRKLVNEVTLLLTYEATKEHADRAGRDRDAARADDRAADRRQEGRRLPGAAGRAWGCSTASCRSSPARAWASSGSTATSDTLEPVEYYVKLPADLVERDAIVLDPMLATGNSSVAAIEKVREAGALSVALVCLVAAPEGIERVVAAYPDVRIVCAAVDRGLNEHGFIVPGLGDAGDRLYGTK